MPYDQQTWSDWPATNTPLSAERLNHIEDGLAAATDAAEAATDRANHTGTQVAATISDLEVFVQGVIDAYTGGGGDGGDGLSVLSGTGAPGPATGRNGEWYIDRATYDLYGPKAAGAWPAPVSLIGPPGDDGPQGNPGPGLPTGGTAGQVPAKASNTDFDTEWVDRDQFTAALASGTALSAAVTDDTTPRLAIGGDGRLTWGPGNAAGDVRLHRSAANILTVRPAADTGTGNVLLEGTAPCTLGVRRTAGTLAAPQALPSGAQLGAFNFEGRASASAWGIGATVAAVTEEAWSDTARGAYLRFQAVTPGTNTVAEKARITGSGLLSIGSQPGAISVGEKLRANTPATVPPSAVAVLTAGATTQVPLVAQGVSGQAAALFEAQNAAGVAVASVSAAGALSAASYTGGPMYASYGNANTTAFSSSPIPLRLQNTNATNNNWVELGFAGSSGSVVAGIAARVEDHATNVGRIGFYTRVAGGGFPLRFQVTESTVQVIDGMFSSNRSGASITNPVRLRNENAAAAEVGTSLDFAGTTNDNLAGQIQCVWNGNAVNNGATMRFLTRAASGAATEWMRLTEAGTLSFPNAAGLRLAASATQRIGFWGAAPVTQDTGWSVTAGYTATRAFNPTGITTEQLARVVATLVDQFKAYGLLG